MNPTFSTSIIQPQIKRFVPAVKGAELILSEEALSFINELHIAFNSRRIQLLKARQQKQKHIDEGFFPDFLPETFEIRKGSWTSITKEGIRQNINIGIRYLESWLRGKAAVALNHTYHLITNK